MTPDELARIHSAAFIVPEPWDAAAFASWIATPGVHLSYAPQALCLTRFVGDEAEILTLAVHPDAQGQGLGKTLLRRAIMAAAQAGAVSMVLEVAQNNPAALALYHNQGFAQVGLRPRYYRGVDGARIDALILRAKI